MEWGSRALVTASGVMGAAGVALAAAASHLDGGSGLQTAALLLVMHAAAVLALATLIGLEPHRARRLGAGAALLVLGATLFAADLAARAYLGGRLFSGAAPAGGMSMIAGWLAVALAAVGRGRA